MTTKLTLLTALVVSSLLAFTQENDEPKMHTLFDSENTSIGGYGGLRIAYSNFNERDILMVGGRGGVIFNSSFVFGGAGYGIVNSPQFENVSFNNETYPTLFLQGGYGGVLFEYILKPNKVVHFTFPVVLGAGSVLFADKHPLHGGPNYNEHIITNSEFFVVEPGVEIELNVIQFMRIAVGASYRLTSEIDLPSMPTNSFNGLTTSISLKFGKF